MRRTIFFVFFISFVVSNLFAQNWDINTLHRVNGWDNKFVRNYNKFISRSEPYVAIGVPVAMALTAWAKKDKDLLKDAVYVGTSVAGAFVVAYGMKYLVDRERPYERIRIGYIRIAMRAVLHFPPGIPHRLSHLPLLCA